MEISVDVADSLDFNFDPILKYAKIFNIINHKDYKTVYVFNYPEKDTLARYVFALHQTQLPDSITNGYSVIRVPIRNIVTLSSSYVGALEVLDLRDKLVGTSNLTYYWDEGIQKRIAEGKVAEVGMGMDANVEQIIALHPDMVMRNHFDKVNSDGRLDKVGIQSILNNEWLESNLLARAEWLKVVGLLFCKSMRADSIYNEIEKKYYEASAIANTTTKKPTILFGQDFKGSWSIPSETSYVAAMLKDVNATYRGSKGPGTSVPYSFEKVYEEHRDDDIWLSWKSGEFNTKADFIKDNERYASFKAFQTGNLFMNNKRTKPGGGNDFWESGVYRPDIVISDLVKIIHPELLPDYETVYWQQLK